jgi:zinc protease
LIPSLVIVDYLFMRRVFFELAFLLLATSLASAQSGRGRQPTAPPPKTVPKPGSPAAAPPGVADGGRLTRQDVDGATTRFVLRNGLTVIVRERHSQPLAAVSVYIKSGSLNEADNEAGLAQLTARLLLKGTAKLGKGEFERAILALGGRLQTEVDFDHTSFRVVAPAESVAKILELEADLLQAPAFPQTEMRQAVAETLREARRLDDQTNPSAVEGLLPVAFTTSRLRRPRFGTDAQLSALSRAQISSFYSLNYQPQNVIIAIVGDVFTSQTILPVQQLFGTWGKPAAPGSPAGAAPASTTGTDEPQQDKLRYKNGRADIGRSLVTIGYRVPALPLTPEGVKERATLEMLSAALATGQGSRLVQVLREGLRVTPDARDKGDLSGLVSDVSFEYHNWARVGGMLVAQLNIDPARIDRAEAEYFREIERFKREVIGEGELQRARFLLEKRYYDLQSRVEYEADLLAFYQARLGESRLIDAWMTQTEAVTGADIQRAAAKYLTSANTTVYEIEPTQAIPRTFTNETFAETMGIFAPAMNQPLKPEDVKQAVALRVFKQGTERGGVTEGRNVIISEAPLPVRDFSILRGARAFVREDKSLPKIVVAILFQGGRLIEDQGTSGTTELMLRTMLKSTTTKKGDLIAHEAESLGGEITVVNEPDFFGLAVSVLSRNAEQVTRLAMDILENPFFDKGELIRERDRLLADQLTRRDDSRARADELMMSSLYPAHPYGMPRLGSREIVKALTEEHLSTWYAKTIQKQFPIVVIVGDTDGSALVSRIFSEGFKRSEIEKTMKVNLPGLTTAPQTEAETRDKRLSSVSVGVRTPAGQSNDIFALSILAPYLSMRATQSAGDQVSSSNDWLLASGTFSASVQADPASDGAARDALLAELGRVASSPPSGDDYDIARNVAIGSYAIKLEDHLDRALEYARAVMAGRKVVDVDTQPDLVRNVRLAEVKRVAETVFKGSQPGVGVVRGK